MDCQVPVGYKAPQFEPFHFLLSLSDLEFIFSEGRHYHKPQLYYSKNLADP